MSNANARVEVIVPFPGLYETIFSAALDDEAEQHAEYHSNAENENSDNSAYPEPLHLDAEEFGVELHRASKYADGQQVMAKEYTETFDQMLADELGIKRKSDNVGTLLIDFVKMTSPREYNFETDRIHATMPLLIAKKLLQMSKEKGHETLKDVAAERHTSGSGFISYYSPDISEWGDVGTWEPVQIETLLIAAARDADIDEDAILARMHETSSVNTAFEASYDWGEYEAGVGKVRAEKLAHWLKDYPVEANAWKEANQNVFDTLVEANPDAFIGISAGPR